MPAKPSAAALRNASSGNSSRSSQPGAYGSHSSRANARAVSWKARCSSERSKSILKILGRNRAPAMTPRVSSLGTRHQVGTARSDHGDEFLTDLLEDSERQL